MKITFKQKQAIKEAVGSNGAPREYPWLRVFEHEQGWIIQIGKAEKLKVTWSDLMTIDAKTRIVTTELDDTEAQKCLDAIVEYFSFFSTIRDTGILPRR